MAEGGSTPLLDEATPPRSPPNGTQPSGPMELGTPAVSPTLPPAPQPSGSAEYWQARAPQPSGPAVPWEVPPAPAPATPAPAPVEVPPAPVVAVGEPPAPAPVPAEPAAQEVEWNPPGPVLPMSVVNQLLLPGPSRCNVAACRRRDPFDTMISYFRHWVTTHQYAHRRFGCPQCNSYVSHRLADIRNHLIDRHTRNYRPGDINRICSHPEWLRVAPAPTKPDRFVKPRSAPRPCAASVVYRFDNLLLPEERINLGVEAMSQDLENARERLQSARAQLQNLRAENQLLQQASARPQESEEVAALRRRLAECTPTSQVEDLRRQLAEQTQAQHVLRTEVRSLRHTEAHHRQALKEWEAWWSRVTASVPSAERPARVAAPLPVPPLPVPTRPRAPTPTCQHSGH